MRAHSHLQFAALRRTGPGMIIMAGGRAVDSSCQCRPRGSARRGAAACQRHGTVSAPRARSDCSACKRSAHQQQRFPSSVARPGPPHELKRLGHKVFLKKKNQKEFFFSIWLVRSEFIFQG